MDSVIPLGPAQQVEGRPFTEVVHNATDLAAMQRVVASLTLLVGQPLQWPVAPQPLVVRSDEEGRAVRVVVCNCPILLANEPIFVVGFFGHRRTDLDVSILSAVDDDLIHEFPMHAGLLSYSSFELADGNYVNVVLLQDTAAKEHWRTSSRHAYAARELAPDFYSYIRLQNALLPRGIGHPEEMQLVATKYYDYHEEQAWLGVRRVGVA